MKTFLQKQHDNDSFESGVSSSWMALDTVTTEPLLVVRRGGREGRISPFQLRIYRRENYKVGGAAIGFEEL